MAALRADNGPSLALGWAVLTSLRKHSGLAHGFKVSTLGLEFGHLGRFFQADTGGTPAVLRALRPEGPPELSPGRRRCALARPGLASGIAESPGRDVGLAASGFSLAGVGFTPRRQAL